MTPERQRQLNMDMDACLTYDELVAGWHWCAEFDGLLVGPESAEWECCICYTEKQKQILENKERP